MAPHRRNNIVSRRRRLEDEGEEEDGSIGDLEDDSLSEGSVLTIPEDDADVEGSDISEGDRETTGSTKADKPADQVNGDGKHRSKTIPPKDPMFGSKMADTEAMMNGMKISEATEAAEEIHFDDMGSEQGTTKEPSPARGEQPQRRETFAERRRREHEEYLKERDENPAFVPTRGGFFLHDKRSENGSNGHRPFNNKKSRPYGLIVDSNVKRRTQSKPDASEGQWKHDLHETVARDDPPAPKPPYYQNSGPSNGSKPVPTAPRSSPPNRSFSSTVLIGNVPVIVHLPGMAEAIPYSAVPKKQHTRLPQHRPPLRRDKPVRISLPGRPPRYIFPAVERSFIFIPRALRPNQQAFHRGRGRGGFYGSRRTSAYGGSAYSPSVAMSRRSSFGRAASREDVHSPAGSVLSRQVIPGPEGGKPVVRLPPSVRPSGVAGPAPVPPPNASPFVPYSHPQQPPYPPPQDPAYRENRPAPIPMHQPRPQKTVSVADIESPAGLSFNPPQQQQEQPFHQQVPPPTNGHGYAQGGPGYPHARHPSHPSQTSGTPLSQIPERAIYAQPFQPYPPHQPSGFYPANQPPGPVFYPMGNPEYPNYGPGPGGAVVSGPGYAPPGPQQGPYTMPPPGSVPPADQSGTVAHESNGMVYYYDSSQLYGGSPAAYPNSSMPMGPPPPGGVVGMGGMMTPPSSGYYYPQPQGVYYPPQ